MNFKLINENGKVVISNIIGTLDLAIINAKYCSFENCENIYIVDVHNHILAEVLFDDLLKEQNTLTQKVKDEKKDLNRFFAYINAKNITEFYVLSILDDDFTHSDYDKKLGNGDRLIDVFDVDLLDVYMLSDNFEEIAQKLDNYYYEVAYNNNKMVSVYDAAIFKCNYDKTLNCIIYDSIIKYAQIDEDFFKDLMWYKYSEVLDVLDLYLFEIQHFFVFNGYCEVIEDGLYLSSTYLKNNSYKGILIIQDIYYNKKIDNNTIEIEDIEKVVYQIIECANSTYNLEEKMGKMRKLTFTKNENGTFKSELTN